jgi:hypothetical protein
MSSNKFKDLADTATLSQYEIQNRRKHNNTPFSKQEMQDVVDKTVGENPSI